MKIFTALMPFLIGFSAMALSSEQSSNPNFSIEGSTYTETMIFLSGVSYGLTYSSTELKNQGKQNFFCYGKAPYISSELLIKLANEELSGNHTSEGVMGVLVKKLKENFPCS